MSNTIIRSELLTMSSAELDALSGKTANITFTDPARNYTGTLTHTVPSVSNVGGLSSHTDTRCTMLTAERRAHPELVSITVHP